VKEVSCGLSTAIEPTKEATEPGGTSEGIRRADAQSHHRSNQIEEARLVAPMQRVTDRFKDLIGLDQGGGSDASRLLGKLGSSWL
jgi:hypothetical protein